VKCRKDAEPPEQTGLTGSPNGHFSRPELMSRRVDDDHPHTSSARADPVAELARVVGPYLRRAGASSPLKPTHRDIALISFLVRSHPAHPFLLADKRTTLIAGAARCFKPKMAHF
jgi:hypothetical protein